jgi:hypothetical protein
LEQKKLMTNTDLRAFAQEIADAGDPLIGAEHAYESKPIGGGNPYSACTACGRSEPEINGDVRGHVEDCSWMKNILFRAKAYALALDWLAKADAIEELEERRDHEATHDPQNCITCGIIPRG